jgi:hypothetical protein
MDVEPPVEKLSRDLHANSSIGSGNQSKPSFCHVAEATPARPAFHSTAGPSTLSGSSDGYIVILQADGNGVVAAPTWVAAETM